jgi:DNA polymerase III subunit delta'
MSLSGVIGHEKPVRILLGTIKRGRVPSSMLLSGDSGIGKAFTALNFAKAINCQSPSNSDACDKCPSCVKIARASHPDVVTIVPENDEIKIETIRQAEEILWLKPYEGLKKVLIVDDADRMNIGASNAFLKTLEEPPPDSLIILISASPDRLPDTVRSRCMHVRFRPLSTEACQKVISLQSGNKDAGRISGLAMGRPGIAITRDFNEDNKWFLDILSSMSRGGSKCAWTDKADIKRWLDLCMVWIRDIAVFDSTGRESDLLCGNRQPAHDLPALLGAAQQIQKVRSVADMNLSKAITWNFVSVIIQDVVARQSNKS